MNNTLEYILKKYHITESNEQLIHIHCNRRKEFPRLLKELDFKVGAEIGVLAGEDTEKYCLHGFKMFGIDPWIAYDGYIDFLRDSLNNYEMEARKRLALYDCTLIKKTSRDAAADFKDESLDFVYIDGNHAFEYVIEDIALWSKKVRKGGIISGHDFFMHLGRNSVIEVEVAVKAWCEAHKITPLFVLDGDKHPSWMYVKQ